MRYIVFATLLFLGFSEFVPCATASAQTEQRMVDSLFMNLRPRQTVRLRLIDGEQRRSTITRIDSNPVRMLLDDGLPGIRATTVDTLRVRSGSYAMPAALVTGSAFAVGLGLAGYVLGCGGSCDSDGTAAIPVLSAFAGAAIGGFAGALIGKTIPRWRVEFGRAPRR